MLLVLLMAGLSVASAQEAGPTSVSGRTPTAMSLTPTEGWSCIRDQQTITASATDATGAVGGALVEFILNRFPEAVGDIVDVTGGSGKSKMDNTYAYADTNGSGQAMATLTATRPGDTDFTAYVPGISDPSAHKDFGVMHWVDPCPTFPPDAVNSIGVDHPVTVSVANVSDGAAVAGVPVRFRVSDDEPDAMFVGAEGDDNVITGTTDDSGAVTVTLRQVAPGLGENTVYIEVLTDDGKTMFSHMMTKTWRSPVLGVTAEGPATVGLLREATYNVMVTNSGDFPATNTMLTVDLPAGLGSVSSTPEGAVSATVGGLGQTITWNLGELAIGQNVPVSFTAQALLTGPQTIGLSVSSDEGLSAQTSIATTAIPGVLQASKTGPSTVSLGGEATYTIQVLSSGTGANTQIRLIDTIPSGMSFVSSDPRGTLTGNQLAFELGTLNQGNLASVQVVLRADAVGEQENIVTATSAEGGSAESTAVTQVVQPVLGVIKTGPDNVLIGSEATYVITISNVGDGDALNATLTETLPAGLQYVSSDPAGAVDGQTIVWNVGTLAPNDSSTVTVTTRAIAGGDQESTVVASADGPTESREASATTFVQVPEITLDIAGRSALFIGNQAEYTLTATNSGDSALSGVTITETIPNGMTYVSSDPAATVSADGTQLSWTVGDLPMGDDSSSVSFTLRADAVGTITNQAGVTTTEGASASSTLEIAVLAAPGASIRISDSVDPVREGEAVDYTVTVSNQGRSAITGVQVEVAIPSALTVTSASEGATVSQDGRTVTYALAEALDVGAESSFVISTTANAVPDDDPDGRVDVVATATLTYSEFTLPVRADEGTTIIEQ